jgi:uncharacterized membrane protein YphA (DoxX/SURF4 family)
MSGQPSVRILTTIARVLLGFLFFAAGVTYFLLPPPEAKLPEAALAFAGALAKSGYMMPLVKGTELVGGALLLANRFVPLGLTLLAPVIVNLALFNFVLAPSGMGCGMSGVIIALELWLAWAYRGTFRPMLAARVTPN